MRMIHRNRPIISWEELSQLILPVKFFIFEKMDIEELKAIKSSQTLLEKLVEKIELLGHEHGFLDPAKKAGQIIGKTFTKTSLRFKEVL